MRQYALRRGGRGSGGGCEIKLTARSGGGGGRIVRLACGLRTSWNKRKLPALGYCVERDGENRRQQMVGNTQGYENLRTGFNRR